MKILFLLSFLITFSPCYAMENKDDHFTKATISIPIDQYAEERIKAGKPIKMLLGCGHTPGADYVIHPGRGPNSSHDINGKGEFHKHIGWYTIDKSAAREPDLTGDIKSEEVCTLLSQRPVFNLVYAEYLPPDVLTPRVLSAIYSSLQKGGKFIFQLLPKDIATGLYLTLLEKEDWVKQNSRSDIRIAIYENADRYIFHYKRAERIGIQNKAPPYVSSYEREGEEVTVTLKDREPNIVKFNIMEDMQNNLSELDEMFCTVDIPSTYAIVEKLD